MTTHHQRSFDLAAIDCDGTLLDSSKSISAGAREAIERTKAAGIQIALITGRNVDAIRFITDALDLNGLVIGCGGAFIYDLSAEKTIESHILPIDKARDLVRVCREMEAILYLEYIHSAIYERTSEAMERMNRLRKYNRLRVPDLLQRIEEAPAKAMIIHQDPKRLDETIDKVKDFKLFDNIVSTGPNSADILPEGVNKGSGLISLSAIMKIPLERIAVIGDWLNDLDMFKVSGFSIAMGNAPAELKSQADLTAPTNDEGGVAWALEQISAR